MNRFAYDRVASQSHDSQLAKLSFLLLGKSNVHVIWPLSASATISRWMRRTTSETLARVETVLREADAFALALIIPHENSQAIC